LLIVHGDSDGWGELSKVRALAGELSGPVDLAIIPGADHFFEAHLEAMMGKISDFVAREGR
jgi:alpha/beta superfamily hydrolase